MLAASAPDAEGINADAREKLDEILKPYRCRPADGTPIRARGVRKWIATYSLEYTPAGGRPISLAETSSATIVFQENGQPVVARLRKVPRRVDAATEAVPRAAASEFARREFMARTGAKDAETVGEKLVVWVSDLLDGYLAWSYTLRSKDPQKPFLAGYYISAVRENILLDVRDLVMQAADRPVEVKGPVWFSSPVGPAREVDLPSSFVLKVSGQELSRPDPAALKNLNRVPCALNNRDFAIVPKTGEGVFCQILDASGAGPLVLKLVPAATSPEAQESALAQITAWYWANKTRETIGPWLDHGWQKLTLYVNRTGDQADGGMGSYGNSYFIPSDFSLNFYKSHHTDRVAYENSATADMIAHEFGHALDYLYLGIVDAGYSHGLGDALAVLVTRQPFIGMDVRRKGAPIRDLSRTAMYPSDPDGDVYEKSQAFGGFVWDLLQSMKPAGAATIPQNKYELVRDLVLIANADNPSSVPDAVRLMFQADDDDANLANGTPNDDKLAVAAMAHKIALPEGLVLKKAITAQEASRPDRRELVAR
jgi:hypothetical protein